jgi:hypothetical protein
MKKTCCNSLAKLNLAQNCEIVKIFPHNTLANFFVNILIMQLHIRDR